MCLILCINSCASKKDNDLPKQLLKPPVVYLEEIGEPLLKGKTNKDLFNFILELQEALRLANSDKKALKEWLSEMDLKLEKLK